MQMILCGCIQNEEEKRRIAPLLKSCVKPETNIAKTVVCVWKIERLTEGGFH